MEAKLAKHYYPSTMIYKKIHSWNRSMLTMGCHFIKPIPLTCFSFHVYAGALWRCVWVIILPPRASGSNSSNSVGLISSCEYKEVVSASSSFCRRSHLGSNLFCILLFFDVLCLSSFIKMWLFRFQTCTIQVPWWPKMSFQYQWKSQFHPKCLLRP